VAGITARSNGAPIVVSTGTTIQADDPASAADLFRRIGAVRRARDEIELAREARELRGFVALFLLLTLVNFAVNVGSGIRYAQVSAAVLFDMRLAVYRHLQRLSLDYYNREKSGRIMTRLTSDIEALQQLFHDGLVNLVVHGFTLIFVASVVDARQVIRTSGGPQGLDLHAQFIGDPVRRFEATSQGRESVGGRAARRKAYQCKPCPHASIDRGWRMVRLLSRRCRC
jgi:hypothetical protein